LSLESAIDLDRAHRAAAGDVIPNARTALLYIVLCIHLSFLSARTSYYLLLPE
jgi:hypothetical protein